MSTTSPFSVVPVTFSHSSHNEVVIGSLILNTKRGSTHELKLFPYGSTPYTIFCQVLPSTAPADKNDITATLSDKRVRLRPLDEIPSELAVVRASGELTPSPWSNADELDEFNRRYFQVKHNSWDLPCDPAPMISLFGTYRGWTSDTDTLVRSRSMVIGRGGEAIIKLVSFLSDTSEKFVVERVKKEGKMATDASQEAVTRLQQSPHADAFVLPLQTFQGSSRHNAGLSQREFLPYCEQGDLQQNFELFETKDKQRAAMKELLTGLQALHDAHVLHRDIKPANILMQEREDHTQLRISDFGAAVPLSNDGTATIICSEGTTQYLPPEAFNWHTENNPWSPEATRTASSATDAWAMGLVLYQILSKGKLPAPLEGNHHDSYQQMFTTMMSEDPAQKAPYNTWWESAMQAPHSPEEEIVLGLLHPDPDQRLTAEAALEKLACI